MADTSTIEWTDATWNPITGCTLVSEGCRHCYAATLAATRLKNHPSRRGLARINAAGEAKFTGEVRLNAEWLDQPLRWRRPRMIFVCAHGDLFHESVPDDWIDRIFAVMALAPHHTFQVLTKRPERAKTYLDAMDRPTLCDLSMEKAIATAGFTGVQSKRIQWPLPNVWLGTSVEDQATADARIPHLLATPAAVRFVSAEPLLGPVNLDRACRSGEAGKPVGFFEVQPVDRLDWVICGGESGTGARPLHPDWARSLRDQCQEAKVPFFFKQWGEFRPGTLTEAGEAWAHHWSPSAGRFIRGLGDPENRVLHLGKKAAGRLLDGREWNEIPECAHG